MHPSGLRGRSFEPLERAADAGYTYCRSLTMLTFETVLYVGPASGPHTIGRIVNNVLKQKRNKKQHETKTQEKQRNGPEANTRGGSRKCTCWQSRPGEV